MKTVKLSPETKVKSEVIAPLVVRFCKQEMCL